MAVSSLDTILDWFTEPSTRGIALVVVGDGVRLREVAHRLGLSGAGIIDFDAAAKVGAPSKPVKHAVLPGNARELFVVEASNVVDLLRSGLVIRALQGAFLQCEVDPKVVREIWRNARARQCEGCISVGCTDVKCSPATPPTPAYDAVAALKAGLGGDWTWGTDPQLGFVVATHSRGLAAAIGHAALAQIRSDADAKVVADALLDSVMDHVKGHVVPVLKSGPGGVTGVEVQTWDRS